MGPDEDGAARLVELLRDVGLGVAFVEPRPRGGRTLLAGLDGYRDAQLFLDIALSHGFAVGPLSPFGLLPGEEMPTDRGECPEIAGGAADPGAAHRPGPAEAGCMARRNR